MYNEKCIYSNYICLTLISLSDAVGMGTQETLDRKEFVLRKDTFIGNIKGNKYYASKKKLWFISIIKMLIPCLWLVPSCFFLLVTDKMAKMSLVPSFGLISKNYDESVAEYISQWSVALNSSCCWLNGV